MAAMATHHKFKMMERVTMCLVLGFMGLTVLECKKTHPYKKQGILYPGFSCRKHVRFLNDYGGIGDGNTLNTAAFKAAISNLSYAATHGGAMLVVPAGKWLTGSFNLISYFTLYLHPKAVILASEDESDYPLIDPLPLYGPRKRFASLIHGENLTDVVITGGNGTIDGQGATWWKLFKANKLNNARPYLIELMSSYEVVISNITLLNSPAGHIHPVNCEYTIIENITIIADVDSPNTDGIIPDSCTSTRIQDVYIISGGDCIAVKSEWLLKYRSLDDGISKHLRIKQLTCVSPSSAVIALGSELSWDISDVRAQQISGFNSQSGVRIKTSLWVGGYVFGIFIRDMNLETMKYGFWVGGDSGDSNYDPEKPPFIGYISFRDIFMDNVKIVGNLSGIKENPFPNFCFWNVTAVLAKEKEKVGPWICANIGGESSRVHPRACKLLQEPVKLKGCYFPSYTEDIDDVELTTCWASF